MRALTLLRLALLCALLALAPAACAPAPEPSEGLLAAERTRPAAAAPEKATATATVPATSTIPATATEKAPATPSAVAPAVVPLPAPTEMIAATPPGAAKSILVSIGAQRVYAYEGERLVFEFPVSTGRNNNTAAGEFQVRNKLASAVNAAWGYQMPHWLGVYWVNRELMNGFHALPLLADGSRLWADQIGTPASDGCIVLLPDDMRVLYEWAEVGTPVVIAE
jgi:lipoprotein-anchoring transpeptidase ErfK/SrfK